MKCLLWVDIVPTSPRRVCTCVWVCGSYAGLFHWASSAMGFGHRKFFLSFLNFALHLSLQHWDPLPWLLLFRPQQTETIFRRKPGSDCRALILHVCKKYGSIQKAQAGALRVTFWTSGEESPLFALGLPGDEDSSQKSAMSCRGQLRLIQVGVSM